MPRPVDRIASDEHLRTAAAVLVVGGGVIGVSAADHSVALLSVNGRRLAPSGPF